MDERQSATPAEALAFLDDHPHVHLLARRADGYPTGYPMTARVRDGAVEFSTYRASAKVRNLLRDGVAGIVATDEASGRVLVAEGPVDQAEGSSWADVADRGPSAPSRLAAAVPGDVTDKVGRRHREGKRIVLRVRIEAARFSEAVGPRR